MTDANTQEIQDAVNELVGPVGSDLMVGGPYEGAARLDQQIAEWNPALNSADLDILPDMETIDARSRDLVRNDAYLQGGQYIHKDSIVGALYAVNSRPDYQAMGLTDEWAEEFQEEVESLFTLWAESPRKWVDTTRQKNLTEMVRLGVGIYCTGGELLATVEWEKAKGRDFKTSIQMVDCDRLKTPPERQWTSNVRGGIKMNAKGVHESYFITVSHQSDVNSWQGPGAWQFKEVAAEKPWGRKQVIYIREQQRVDQTRAVADLVAALKASRITAKFRDITLQNAVVNAMYAASIESELPSSDAFYSMGASPNRAPGDAALDFATEYLDTIAQYVNKANNIRIDGVKIPHMFPGTKLQLRPAGTPGGVGQGFEQSLLRYIASALGVSYEELSRDFTKTNYSSARAAMSNTWKFMQSRKKIVADAFANDIFRCWLEEAINNNKLKSFPASKAGMLYTDGVLNLMFDALSRCEWIGAARGQIDELKETQASVLKMKMGLSTYEDELGRQGKDWRAVFRQRAREEKLMKKLGIASILEQEDNSMNAASGTPRNEDEEKGDEEK